MKKTMIITFVAAVLGLTSCEKDNTSKSTKGDTMMTELVSLEHIVTLSSSDYDRIEAEPLTRPDSKSPYSSGIIQYRESGEVTASIDFSLSGENKASYSGKDGDKEVDLSKGKEWSKEAFYTKVIVEPIVKTDDCDYIVAGSIEFYDIETGEWLATIDYGDGTCDEMAVKTTAEGDYTFSQTDWK